ncbi:hypothetical protein HanIR_Chr09g0401111 [Helianthus annuus]|nr:hypothetical protein HanIR_Chr09g0401111 [Helianthus annuus]
MYCIYKSREKYLALFKIKNNTACLQVARKVLASLLTWFNVNQHFYIIPNK